MRSNQRRWTSVLVLALFSIGLLIIPAFGQAPEQPKPKTEAEILKERLQQLEQTVSELKDQLNAMEAAKKAPPKPVIVEATYTPGTSAAAASTDATDTAVPAAKKQVQGESSVEIYGFAMLDAGYQFKQNHPDWFDTLRVTKLPAFANEFGVDGHTYWGVRQSRLVLRHRHRRSSAN